MSRVVLPATVEHLLRLTLPMDVPSWRKPLDEWLSMDNCGETIA
jgi:hypothetical protein